MNEVGVTDHSGANEIEVTELSQGSPASESEPEVKSGGGLNHHSPLPWLLAWNLLRVGNLPLLPLPGPQSKATAHHSSCTDLF